MLQHKQIVVPLEMHENAVPVVRWAVLMAQATESRLTMLHVNESLEPLKTRPAFHGGLILEPPATVAERRHAYEQAARQELAHLVEQYCAGVPAETVLLEGRAHHTILEYLDKTPCDVVVMGTHGRPWYQWLLLGSTVEAVLRAASVPILIVPNAPVGHSAPQLTRLVLPTDFSTCSQAGEAWALALAARGMEEVTLVHTVENPLLDIYDPDTAEIDFRRLMEESRHHPPRSAQPFWEHAHQVAREKLLPLRQQLLGAGVQVALRVQDGPAAEEILTVAESADLIVMATHGRSGARRLLLGSVTEKVVRAAPCPVLAVRSR